MYSPDKRMHTSSVAPTHVYISFTVSIYHKLITSVTTYDKRFSESIKYSFPAQVSMHIRIPEWNLEAWFLVVGYNQTRINEYIKSQPISNEEHTHFVTMC